MQEKGIQTWVVNLPSWRLFEEQSEDYRRQVLPPGVKARLAIEAGSTQGWHRYVGTEGAVLGLDHFGASAPYKILYEKFGLTVDSLVKKALEILEKLKN